MRTRAASARVHLELPCRESRAVFDTKEQILNQLRAGEDGRAAFEEVRLGERGVISPNTEDVAGELAALANAAGGVVFLGIDDTGAVRGIPAEHVDTVENLRDPLMFYIKNSL